MRVRVRRWGNGLAVPIPQTLADQLHLVQGADVELTMVDGCIVIAPVMRSGWTLERLLDGVTERNLHAEVATGGAVGRELL